MESQYFDRFGIMIDCSRNAVPTVANTKKWVDRLKLMGYNTLFLYMEDTYEIKEEPYFGYLRGRYTQEELREIDDYAFSQGIELIPCIQTLAHLRTIFKWPVYQAIQDLDDTITTDMDRTYELIEHMFASLHDTVRTRTIHIGMDEAYGLGRGLHLDRFGYEDPLEIILRHLNKVCAIAKKYGFDCIMWSDMFIRHNGHPDYMNDTRAPDPLTDEMRAKIPENCHIVYWDYYFTNEDHYERQIGYHKAIREPLWFAGGLWHWTGMVPHNRFSMEATKAAFAQLKKHGIRNVFLTIWGDDGAESSLSTLLPAMFYASALARGIEDMATIKKEFEKTFGLSFDDAMLFDLPGTVHDEGDIRACPDRYMLFNDCFYGLLDLTVRGIEAGQYRACAEKLKPLMNHPEYGYLYRTLEKLCEVLAVKYDIGVLSRKHYKAGDRTELAALLPVYDDILVKVDELYYALREQWMLENKPNGFEVQDMRFGGLMCRVRHCRERLAAYLAGDLETLPELEETLLPYADGSTPILENRWGRVVSVNPFGSMLGGG